MLCVFKFKVSLSFLITMDSHSQISAIHFCHAPFSLLSQHPTLLFIFNHSFTELNQLLRGRLTELLPLQFSLIYPYSSHAIFIISLCKPIIRYFRQSFHTPLSSHHKTLTRVFEILSIFLIPGIVHSYSLKFLLFRKNLIALALSLYSSFFYNIPFHL